MCVFVVQRHLFYLIAIQYESLDVCILICASLGACVFMHCTCVGDEPPAGLKKSKRDKPQLDKHVQAASFELLQHVSGLDSLTHLSLD